MSAEHLNLQIVFILAVGFSTACLFGYLAKRLKLSEILGYLVAGYLVGPYSPGFRLDLQVSEQLAELGAVLMMFSVGMRFRWKDLAGSKFIALLGALPHTLIITAVGTALFALGGYSWLASIILGVSLSIACNVVLIRQLSDYKLLNTREGRTCISWMITEDKIGVAFLVLLPIVANGETVTFQTFATSLFFAFLKFFILVVLLFTIGKKFAAYVLTKVQLTKSHELFTIAILGLALLFATIANTLFGTSLAIGAFLAGMCLSETNHRNAALQRILPLKDAFIVLFFLTVGMLFMPTAIWDHYILCASSLLIIVLFKPLSAFCIMRLFDQPLATGLTTAVGLAQIGEFSFILTEEASRLDILPDSGFDIIMASAWLAIALNPLLFKMLGRWKRLENT